MKRGFTLSELLIAVSLVMLLLLILFVNWRRQIDRSYDTKRKSDLATIKRVYEEYYNDHNCYPPADTLTHCGGPQLQPYLAAIPCDPQTKQPYNYVPLDALDLCKGYRVFASLLDTSDSDITRLGCSGITGCGFGALWNYGVSSTNLNVAATGFDPNATPTPVPPGQYACAPGGFCNSYSDPVGSGCPITFADRNCNNQCSNPANWCRQ